MAAMIDQKIRILIVDDEPKFRKALSKMIEEQSDMVVVGEAGDGLSGIEQYKTLQPDLVSTNVLMPIMDGFTMTEEICKIDPVANILICSATIYVEERQKRAIEVGAKAWLSKPFSKKEYVDIVRKVAEEEGLR